MANLDREQRRIVRLIRAEGRQIKNRKVRRIYERAAVETGLVESGLRNLNYGDADSQGWRQERKSLYRDPTNLRASIRRFRQEFQQMYDPGETAGQVAAQVQRPAAQYRGRYQERLGEAKQILGQVAGGGGMGPVGAGSGPAFRTIPGVDNSSARQQLQLQYLQTSHDPNALLNLAYGLQGAQDTPSSRVRIRQSGGNNSRGGGSGGGGRYGKLYELFWQGAGGIDVKNGSHVPQGFVDGHTDHVHVAARQNDLLKLGRLAQRMGLDVGENPAFGGVNPVHVQDSYHYGRTRGREHDRAIDVSGDPALMRKFAHRVARLYGI